MPPLEGSADDAALVARARRGEAAAFEALVRRHYRPHMHGQPGGPESLGHRRCGREDHHPARASDLTAHDHIPGADLGPQSAAETGDRHRTAAGEGGDPLACPGGRLPPHPGSDNRR